MAKIRWPKGAAIEEYCSTSPSTEVEELREGGMTTGDQDKQVYERELVDVGRHPEDESFLRIEKFQDETTQYLTYHLGTNAYERGVAAGVEFDEAEWPLLIAEYDLKSRVLTTYPTWLRSNIPVFSKPKYNRIKRISFEDQDPLEVHNGFDMILDLPTGFLKRPFEGFGVDPRIKHIVQAFEELPQISGLIICIDDDISIEGTDVRLPEHIYHEVRININRVHDATVDFANGEKKEYLRSRMLPSILPAYSGEAHFRSVEDLVDVVHTAIQTRGTPKSRNTNRSAAVRTVMKSVDEIAKEDPVQIFQLSEKLELVTLELLIESMSEGMQQGHREGHWQAFFKANPFVLKVLFGLPVVLYVDQASVGGMGHRRTGEKFADFLLEAGAFGNLAIVEIKTTGTQLMTRKPYRPPSLFGPSPDLAGGVSQLLEQRYNLMSTINQKKAEDDNYHIQAWSVPCILIIGKNPIEKFEKRSFELYRGGQRDVLIITFDELLAKLKALHEFLVTKPGEAHP